MSFRVIAGDFHSLSKYSSSSLLKEKKLIAAIVDDNGKGRTEEINLKGNIDRIDIVTEENKKSFVGAAGLGLVGAAALGPLGLIAGALAGGNKKEVCFLAYLKDGRKFMAVADNGTYQEIVAAQFEKPETTPPKKASPWLVGTVLALFFLIVIKLFS